MLIFIAFILMGLAIVALLAWDSFFITQRNPRLRREREYDLTGSLQLLAASKRNRIH